MNHQPGILADLPPLARYLELDLVLGGDPSAALRALADVQIDERLVVGLGDTLIRAAGAAVEGLRPFPALCGVPVPIPSTPLAAFVWLRGDDRGGLLHRGRALLEALAPHLAQARAVDAFRYADGRDLSGYVDGTENPRGDDALAAAFDTDGSSFLATQRWVHDLGAFQRQSPRDRDDTIGRRISDNEELPEAPDSAHVKRTAQEDFEPTAFVLRRSMPWADARQEGLVFAAFGRSLCAFEAQLRRMCGLDDGIVDALFRFTRPVTGATLWCPPVSDGRLDLQRAGL